MNFKKVICIPAIYSKKSTPESMREYVLADLGYGSPVGTQDEIAEFIDAKIKEPCMIVFKTLEGKQEAIFTEHKAGKL